jgi:hypothetical protein
LQAANRDDQRRRVDLSILAVRALSVRADDANLFEVRNGDKRRNSR